VRFAWNVLIASSRLETRRALMCILDGLPVNTIASRTVAQAQKVLAKQQINIVFCDDVLPDGTYRDLLLMRSIGKPRVVVTTHTFTLKDHYEAVVQGAFAVLECPPESINVELIVFHAARLLRGQPSPGNPD
jgi:DNA-binding NtrC family response regulator